MQNTKIMLTGFQSSAIYTAFILTLQAVIQPLLLPPPHTLSLPIQFLEALESSSEASVSSTESSQILFVYGLR